KPKNDITRTWPTLCNPGQRRAGQVLIRKMWGVKIGRRQGVNIQCRLTTLIEVSTPERLSRDRSFVGCAIRTLHSTEPNNSAEIGRSSINLPHQATMISRSGIGS
ncbi:MAG: hypothetical protein KUA43_23060, partial [Hoeflea sp.]|uniref:hypothetical protein n=1 Tax=Hoeflea sp. TaxID=1940281 RepID=UPI001E0DEB17